MNKKIKCACCLSARLKPRPLDLAGYWQCRDCGLVFMPFDTKGNTIKSVCAYYRDEDPHDRVAASKQVFFSTAIDRLNAVLPKPKKTILDVGCSHGHFLKMAADCGWKPYGVELEAKAAASAEKRAKAASIFRGTLKKADFSDRAFDAVTLWDVLEFCENPFEDILECRRILMKGGVLGIRVRNNIFHSWLHRAYLPFAGLGAKIGVKDPTVFHPYCFGPRSIKILLARAGFSNIIVENSSLTKGDPYDQSPYFWVTEAGKFIANAISQSVFWASGKTIITGPSLLVWAQKNV